MPPLSLLEPKAVESMKHNEVDLFPSIGAQAELPREKGFCLQATLVGLASLLVGASVLRLWGLGTRSLWFDEAYSVYVSRKAASAITSLLEAYDTHPPLYYFLLHAWVAAFGGSEVVVRSLSVLAGVLGVLGTFVLGSRVARNGVGGLAAAFVAVSPFHIAASQEARMYSLLTALGAASFLLLWLALEGRSARYWFGYVIVTALALYTHHFAALLVLAQAVYVVGFEPSGGNRRRWFLSMAAVAFLYLPNISLLGRQVLTARAWPDIRPPFGLGALTDLLGMLSFGGGLFGMGTYFRRGSLGLEYRVPLLLPFVLLAVAGVAGLSDRRRRAFVLSYLLIPVAVVSLISLRWNIFYERYFSFVLPPYAILLASGVTYTAGDLRSRQRAAIAAGLVAMVAAYQWAGLTVFTRTPSSYDWRALARHVASRAEPQDYILYIPAFARIPFEYYFNGPQARASLNPREVIVARDDVRFQAEVDTVRMADVAREHPRMWIVATVPIGYEARKQIARALAPYFREVEGRSFGLVYAFLWESKTWKSARLP